MKTEEKEPERISKRLLFERVEESLILKTRRLFLMQNKYNLKTSEIFRELLIAYKEVNKCSNGLVVIQLEYLIRQLERHEQLRQANRIK